MKKIYDYSSIDKLDNSNFFNKLCDGIIITATSEMQASLVDHYSGKGLVVTDIHKIVNALLPEWDSEAKRIKNYILLRNCIEKYAKGNNVSDALYSSLERNAYDIWNSILLLTEADIYPDNIMADDDIAQAFKEIWRDIEKDNEDLLNVRSVFLRLFGDKVELRSRLGKMEDKAVGEMLLTKPIYLIGFYFITPIQDRVINLLERWNGNITQLNAYDCNEPFACEIWEENYRDFYDAEGHKIIQAENNKNFSFLSSFDNTLPLDMRERIQVRPFSSDFELASMIAEAIKNGDEFYSLDVRRGKKLQEVFFPELSKKKKWLSYPVGQYVFQLHKFWDPRNNEIKLNSDDIQKCFASGWLRVDGKNGQDYLYQVESLLIYFQECKSIEKWNQYREILYGVREATSCFNGNKGDRWEELLGNPFSNISYLALSDDTIEILFMMIDKIIQDVNFLFDREDRVDLYEHFKRVSKIIQEDSKSVVLEKEETELIKEFMLSMVDASFSGVESSFGSICTALSLLVGSNDKDNNRLEEEQTDNTLSIKPFVQIDSLCLNDNKGNIHLIYADENGLPGEKRSLPWPLTKDFIEKIQIDPQSETSRYLRDMVSIINNKPLAMRYLFFETIKSITTTQQMLLLDYVDCERGKTIGSSPYAELMHLNIKKESQKKNRYVYDDTVSITDWNIERNIKELPVLVEETRRDYDTCQLRYIYGYILSRLPSYRTEFHYQFLISRLIGGLARKAGNQYRGKIAEELKCVFPFFSEVQFQQSYDYGKASTDEQYKEVYNDNEYPGERLLIRYLTKDVLDITSEQIEHSESDGWEPLRGEQKKKTCQYCPYRDCCIDSYKERDEING